MSGLQWFRLYTRTIDDEALRLLAFEDRWHFIALCCLKGSGLLDEPCSDMRSRKIAVKLGVQLRELDEISRRLQEVGLIDKTMCPVSWQKLQFKSDTSTDRVKKHREKQQRNDVKRFGNVSETDQNRTEQNRAEQKQTKNRAVKLACPDGVDHDLWEDFRRIRKRPVTARVLAGIEREAVSIGWTLEQALTKAVERGWQSFEADWVKGNTNVRSETNRAGYPNGSADKRDGIARALDRRLGLDEPAGEAGRRDAGTGEGYFLLGASRPASV